MFVHKITPVTYRSNIVDAHAHIGNHEGKIYTKGSLDVFVKSPLPNGDNIEKFIVSNLDVLHGEKDEFQGNTETLNELKNDSHYAILASCNPAKGNINQIIKLYEENPDNFVGLKFHPTFNMLNPTDIRYEPYYEFAEKKCLPCLFHTAVNVDENGKLSKIKEPYSDPEDIYIAAKRHPSVPFVFAHLGAGWRESHDKAIRIMSESIKKGDANLYADISWVDIDNPNIQGYSSKEHIIKAIKELRNAYRNGQKSDELYRLLFGTDVPLARFHDWYHPEALNDYAKFADDIKYAIKNDSELSKDAEKIINDLFSNNAKKLYMSRK